VVLQFYDNASVQTPFGYAALVWMATLGKWFLNGFYKPACADNVSLVISVLYIAMALIGIILPVPYSKFWGMDITTNKKSPCEALHFNVFFLVYHIQKVLFLQGVAAHRAIGFSSLIGFVFFVDGYFGSKGIVKILEKPKPAYLFWLLFFGLLCSDILFLQTKDAGIKEEL